MRPGWFAPSAAMRSCTARGSGAPGNGCTIAPSPSSTSSRSRFARSWSSVISRSNTRHEPRCMCASMITITPSCRSATFAATVLPAAARAALRRRRERQLLAVHASALALVVLDHQPPDLVGIIRDDEQRQIVLVDLAFRQQGAVDPVEESLPVGAPDEDHRKIVNLV